MSQFMASYSTSDWMLAPLDRTDPLGDRYISEDAAHEDRIARMLEEMNVTPRGR